MSTFDIAISDDIKITWKVGGLSDLVKNNDFLVESPSFAVEDEIWYLRIHHKREDKFVKLSLVRLEYDKFSQYSVSYSIALKDKDGCPYICEYIMKDESDSVTFKENENSVILSSCLVNKYIKKTLYYIEYVSDEFLILFISFHKITNIKKEKTIGITPQRENFVPQECTAKLVKDLKNLFLSKVDSDITIRVKDCEFPVHKAIVGVRSPVFAALLRSEMKEKSTGVVDIHDLDPEAFQLFLSFLYSGSINELSTKNVFGVYKAADMYDVEDLKSNCLQFMKHSLSLDSFCDVISIALLHDDKELLQTVISYFSKNMVKILETVKWQTFLSENPIRGNELIIKVLKNK